MAAISCRICCGKAERLHYTALFSTESLKVDLPGRISRLLGVPVVQDNCPSRNCRGCMRKFTTTECSLRQLQQNAQSSYLHFSTSLCTRKRTNDTSGTIGVSPHTQRVRPPSKRMATLVEISFQQMTVCD